MPLLCKWEKPLVNESEVIGNPLTNFLEGEEGMDSDPPAWDCLAMYLAS
jgi:hypothetical protein